MNFNSLFVKSFKTRSQLYNYQTVRWIRAKKPFWLGIAKSKMFVIKQPKYIPTPEEKKQNQLLKQHYNTHYKSLMNFIKVDDPKLNEVALDTNKISPVLEQKMAESLKENERWNNECAKLRDKRMNISMEKDMEKAIREINVREEIRMKKLEILEEIVRKEKQLSASYITPENLDEEIEKCLSKEDCFDFAIDFEGNRYHGRKTLEAKNEPQEMPQEMPVESAA